MDCIYFDRVRVYIFIHSARGFYDPTHYCEQTARCADCRCGNVGSIVGGAIAYLIGAWLYDSVGTWLIMTFSNPELIESTVRPMFTKYGVLIIVLTAVTPIPYKLLAIWLGFIGFPMWIFLGVSALFRSARFAIVGYLLWQFQERANAIVKKYFWPLTLGAIIAAGLGICLITLF